MKDKQTSLSLPSSASSSTMWGSSIVGPDDSVGSSVPDSVGNVSVVIVTVVGNGTLTRTDWFCVWGWGILVVVSVNGFSVVVVGRFVGAVIIFNSWFKIAMHSSIKIRQLNFLL